MVIELNEFKENPIGHAYVIRAIENALNSFELKICEFDMESYCGIWTDENIITLYGNHLWCKKYFDKYYKIFNFYDLRSALAKEILNNKPFDFDVNYIVEEYYLMANDFSKEINNLRCEINNILLIKRDEHDNSVYYDLVKDGSSYVGKVKIDRVNETLIILSELSVNIEYRNKGYGKYIFSEIFRRYSNNTIILFVNKTNEIAISFYEKLGFDVIDEYMNFEFINNIQVSILND